MRQSNLELLRIIAMFLVLVVHADFFSLGAPSNEELLQFPLPSLTRLFFESISVNCVNVFVLLSGWFGIRFSIKGLAKFLFQVFFFRFGIYLSGLSLGVSVFSISGLLHCFLLDKLGWFIKAYLLLFILSPILNSFINTATKHQFQVVLIGFYFFQTIFGFLFDGSVSYFNGGYSVVSFIGLYLLAQYMHRFCMNLKLFNKVPFLGGLFIVLISINTVLLAITKCLNLDYFFNLLWLYTNPLVIISALLLLLIFNKCNFQSKVINNIASYSFAVYLFHTHSLVLDNYFKPCIISVFNSNEGIICLSKIFVVLISFYVIATLLDIIREFCWHQISEYFYINHYLSKYNR